MNLKLPDGWFRIMSMRRIGPVVIWTGRMIQMTVVVVVLSLFLCVSDLF